MLHCGVTDSGPLCGVGTDARDAGIINVVVTGSFVLGWGAGRSGSGAGGGTRCDRGNGRRGSGELMREDYVVL